MYISLSEQSTKPTKRNLEYINHKVKTVVEDVNALRTSVAEVIALNKCIVTKIQGLYVKNVCDMTFLVQSHLPMATNEEVDIMFTDVEYRQSITSYIILNINPIPSTYCGAMAKRLFTKEFMATHGFPRQ